MPRNQEVIPQGRGLLAGNLTKTKSLQFGDFTLALHVEKSISPIFPGPQEDVVANDWCIKITASNSLVCLLF